MNIKNQGFYWHVHHRILIEWCYDYVERTKYIRTEKAKDQRETRLRLFQPVKGDLPQEVIKARQALNEARRVYNKQVQSLYEARQAYYEKERASQAYYKALKKNMPAIEALHKKECPNCPWDGHTIFPNA
ncbi:MAG: hypothetical protein ABIF89_00160 [bacterium]